MTDPEIIKDYFNKRLNRIIADYLLRDNKIDSAKVFVDETALEVSLI